MGQKYPIYGSSKTGKQRARNRLFCYGEYHNSIIGCPGTVTTVLSLPHSLQRWPQSQPRSKHSLAIVSSSHSLCPCHCVANHRHRPAAVETSHLRLYHTVYLGLITHRGSKASVEYYSSSTQREGLLCHKAKTLQTMT